MHSETPHSLEPKAQAKEGILLDAEGPINVKVVRLGGPLAWIGVPLLLLGALLFAGVAVGGILLFFVVVALVRGLSRFFRS